MTSYLRMRLHPRHGNPNDLVPSAARQWNQGFPIEFLEAGAARAHVTYWAAELPREGSVKWLGTGLDLGTGRGSPVFKPRKWPPERVLMGFSCTQCGFVELYTVQREELARFLRAQPAP